MKSLSLLKVITMSSVLFSLGTPANSSEAPQTNTKKKEDSISAESVFDDSPFKELNDEIDISLTEEKKKQAQPRKNTPQFEPKMIRKKSGTFRIKHPNSSKGLYKITQDKTYHYKVSETPQKHSTSVRGGLIQFPLLLNEETERIYTDFYDENVPVLLIDYERQFNFLGRIGLKFGSGVTFSRGVGEFAGERNKDRDPIEDIFFFVLPNSLGLTYKMQFIDNQFLVPYVTGGLDAYTFFEVRSDLGRIPKMGISTGGHVAGGAALNLRFLNPRDIIEMDREYGINGLFLTVEYRRSYHFSGEYDFSTEMITGGFGFDY